MKHPVRKVFDVHNLEEKLKSLSPAKRELLRRRLNQNAGSEPPDFASEKIAAPRRPDRLPLSFAQRRIWFLQQLDPAQTAYNMPFGVALEGELNPGALERALGEIIRRHEILRTNFRAMDNVPFQWISAPFEIKLTVEDFTHLPGEEREIVKKRISAEEAGRLFDLETDRLIAFRLVRFGERKHVLFLTLHHIVADGWSLGVLAKEFVYLYRNYAAEIEARLPELPIQYADYALAEENCGEDENFNRRLAFWKEAFDELPPELNLPERAEKPEKDSVIANRAGYYSFSIEEELSEMLETISRAAGTTLFMTVLTAFKILLSRYSRQPDIAVGTPIAGRTRTELENLIGFFVNTLVLRTRLRAGASFSENLQAVRKTVLDAFDNQYVPFEMLVKELKISGDRQKLFRAMFVWQEAAATKIDLPSLEIEFFDVPLETPKFDLTLGMAKRGNRISGTFEFDRRVFSEQTIENFAANLKSVLREAGRAPHAKLTALALLTERDESFLRRVNQTATDFPNKPIHELIAEKAAEKGEKLALAGTDRTLSFFKLNERAETIALRLIRNGLKPEAVVGVLLEPSAEMIACQLAVMKAGGAYLPLDPALPAERLNFILSDAGASFLLTARRFAGSTGKTSARRFLIEDLTERERTGSAPPPVKVSPQNLAYVIYTSGSTGKPKGVAVSHESLANLIDWHARAFGTAAGDRCSRLAGAGFDPSVWETWANLAAGASLHLPPEEIRVDPAKLKKWLADERITQAYLPTPLAEALLKENPVLPDLKILSCGGDRLHFRPDRTTGFELINLYGPTECTVNATAGKVATKKNAGGGAPSIGKPVQNTQIFILDDFCQPTPLGGVGEIYIGGAGLARGYLGRAGLTAERFVPHPFSARGERLYKTGDLGRFLANGEIEFLGRVDDQIKLRGFRIEPGEIERVLSGIEEIRSAAVVAAEKGGEKYLAAFLVFQTGARLSVEEIRKRLVEQLPLYMIPQFFEILGELPLTPNGKIDRRKLAQRDPVRAETARFAAPRGETENRLARIWESLLKVDSVGADANFFEIGGHSLLAAQMTGNIEREFGKSVSLAEFFRYPTIGDLARRIGQGADKSPDESIVLLSDGQKQSPLFLIHPVLGEVSCYLELTRALDGGSAVYGVQSPGLFSAGAAGGAKSVEETALVYARQIEAVQKDGAYRLGGWSMGGVIAFEIARLLIGKGKRVDRVMLLDSFLSDRGAPFAEIQIIGNFARQLGFGENALRKYETGAAGEPEESVLGSLRSKLPERNFAARFSEEQFIKLFKVYRANLIAWQNYRPEKLNVELRLVQASEKTAASKERQAARWRALCPEKLGIFETEGDHFSMMRAPQVFELAARLSEILEKPR